MDLSIIVPVYNVEKYLQRCIDSVLHQPISNYEIILVDDGSKDNSSTICDQYATVHAHISVIHQKNAGLSMARNNGMKCARGKFIMFLDSDDYVEENSLQALMEWINGDLCDVVVGLAWIVNDVGEKKPKIQYNVPTGRYSKKDYIDIAINRVSVPTFCAPFFLCRREFLENNNLQFMSGILHEDELWTPQVLLKAETICFSGVYFYNHYIREGSITHPTDGYERSAESLLKIYRILDKLYDDYPQELTAGFRNKLCIHFFKAVLMFSDPMRMAKEFGRVAPMKNAQKGRQKMKAALFFLSPRLYCWIGHRLGHYS